MGILLWRNREATCSWQTGNTLENARVSSCYCAEMNKRSVCPGNTLEDAIISFCFRIIPLSMHPFCCEGSAKPPAVRRLDNTIEHARVSFRSAEETSVQANANGFDEATQKSIPEASKPHLPHKSLSWMRFVTSCFGGLANGASFCCGGTEKLPAVGRLDNTLKHAPFCCEGSAKSPAVC